MVKQSIILSSTDFKQHLRIFNKHSRCIDYFPALNKNHNPKTEIEGRSKFLSLTSERFFSAWLDFHILHYGSNMWYHWYLRFFGKFQKYQTTIFSGFTTNFLISLYDGRVVVPIPLIIQAICNKILPK